MDRWNTKGGECARTDNFKCGGCGGSSSSKSGVKVVVVAALNKKKGKKKQGKSKKERGNFDDAERTYNTICSTQLFTPHIFSHQCYVCIQNLPSELI